MKYYVLFYCNDISFTQMIPAESPSVLIFVGAGLA